MVYKFDKRKLHYFHIKDDETSYNFLTQLDISKMFFYEKRSKKY